MSEVQKLLTRIEEGDVQATGTLLPIVYEELRSLAKARLANELPGISLQATELVHEAYLRLLGADQEWNGTSHFFAAAAEAMRRILVDRARARKSQRRGGDRKKVDLHDSALKASRSDNAADEVLMVDELLSRLSVEHQDEGEIAKLCYFADFNVTEAAKALQIPVSTAHKRWNYAKAWLRREFQKDQDPANE